MLDLHYFVHRASVPAREVRTARRVVKSRSSRRTAASCSIETEGSGWLPPFRLRPRSAPRGLNGIPTAEQRESSCIGHADVKFTGEALLGTTQAGRAHFSILFLVSAFFLSMQELKGHTSLVRWVAFSPDAVLLAAASEADIRLWEVPSGKPHGTLFLGRGRFVTSLAFSPDGKILAAGGT